MIWTILLASLAAYFIYLRISSTLRSGDISPLTPALLCFVLLGIWNYAPQTLSRSLQSEAEEIVHLRKGIDEIRASIYESNKKEMFDSKNMSQSRALTEYTSEVLEKEAKYNRRLKDFQLAMKSRGSFWFGIGAMLPDEIMELKPL
jgi:hypothetical protein